MDFLRRSNLEREAWRTDQVIMDQRCSIDEAGEGVRVLSRAPLAHACFISNMISAQWSENFDASSSILLIWQRAVLNSVCFLFPEFSEWSLSWVNAAGLRLEH